jgi:hypothetical protein
MTGPQPSPELGVYPSGEVKPVCEVLGCVPSLNGISFRAESWARPPTSAARCRGARRCP